MKKHSQLFLKFPKHDENEYLKADICDYESEYVDVKLESIDINCENSVEVVEDPQTSNLGTALQLIDLSVFRNLCFYLTFIVFNNPSQF